MKNSAIEWTDHTFNPWEGCTKVSPGCAHCYAEARNRRFAGGANWGPGAPRRRTSAQNWKQPLRWNAEAEEDQRLSYGQAPRPRVFCASLADWLDDDVPIEWLADLLNVIRQAPHLDWLLLTKRPQNWRGRITAAMQFARVNRRIDLQAMLAGWLLEIAPENVWIGGTAEDQERADERIPLLLEIPARVRFLSCEPLLGPVDLRVAEDPHGVLQRNFVPGIQWVICGGESGAGARPMHPDWARSLRDQCASAAVPFFFKQWGEWLPACQYRPGDLARFREKAQHTFDADNHSFWVGKIAAGRLLDGREHNDLPLVA